MATPVAPRRATGFRYVAAVPVDPRQVVAAYWAAADARDWEAFAALVAADVVYEVPQTRERVRGREAYRRFNAEYPGDWSVTVERVIGAGSEAVSWTRFEVDGEVMTGLCFFVLDDDGLIAHLSDFWPEPYDPPPGREHLVERW